MIDAGLTKTRDRSHVRINLQGILRRDPRWRLIRGGYAERMAGTVSDSGVTFNLSVPYKMSNDDTNAEALAANGLDSDFRRNDAKCQQYLATACTRPNRGNRNDYPNLQV